MVILSLDKVVLFSLIFAKNILKYLNIMEEILDKEQLLINIFLGIKILLDLPCLSLLELI
jgi:hypothetical protein